MTSLKMWTGVCVMLLTVGMSVSGTAVAQDPKAQDVKIAEGMLMNIDQNARVLTLNAGDNEMQFSYTEQTELVAPGNDGKPVAVTQGTKMRVHYVEHEKTKTAIKIEIIEVTAAH